jgi:septum formation protein
MPHEQALIHLASQSPRRRELLDQLCLPFHPLPVAVDESPLHDDEAPEVLVLRLALAKARAGWAQIREQWPLPVLAADTVVVCSGRVLGKPHDADQAAAMLRALSGASHKVLTGVALVDDRQASRLSVSTVTLRALREQDIRAYLRTDEPWDKAGAYAIQGLAAAFVEHLDGSYSGVMGLPLFEVSGLLDEFSVEYRQCWEAARGQVGDRA